MTTETDPRLQKARQDMEMGEGPLHLLAVDLHRADPESPVLTAFLEVADQWIDPEAAEALKAEIGRA